MSTPYSTAVALIYGKAGLQEFGGDVLENDTVKVLTKKVEVIADEELSSIFPDKQSAILTIVANGKAYSERVDFPKGEPENPLSEDEFKTRYDALMAYGCVDKVVSDAIYSKVNEQNAIVEELIEKL
jgi:2-methylcitrate dehydratase PrpD